MCDKRGLVELTFQFQTKPLEDTHDRQIKMANGFTAVGIFTLIHIKAHFEMHPIYSC